MIRCAVAVVLATLLLSGCQLEAPKVEPVEPRVATPGEQTIETGAKIEELHFASDSRYFAHLSKDGSIELWDVLLEARVRQRAFPGGASGMDLVGPARIAVADSKGVHIFGSGEGQDVILPLPSGPVSFVQFGPEGKQVAVGKVDGAVTVIDVATKEVQRQLRPETLQEGWRAVAGAGFGALFTDGPSRLRYLPFDGTRTESVVEFERHPGDLIALARQAEVLACLNADGEVEVRGLAEVEARAVITGLAETPEALALSPDGSVVATVLGSSGIELWDAETGSRLASFHSSIWPGGSVCFSPDGYLLAWAEGNRTKLRFWSPVGDLVEWRNERPVLPAPVRAACDDLAGLLRYRLASAPFQRAVALLDRGEVDEARRALVEVRQLLPRYPGLAEATADAERRYEAGRLAVRVGAEAGVLEQQGKYREALAAIDGFLREYGMLGDWGLRRRGETLRQAIEIIDVAEMHRAAGRKVEAIEEFDKAVALVPNLAQRRPEYAVLRDEASTDLWTRAAAALGEKRYQRVLEICDQLRRIRTPDAATWLAMGLSHENLGDVAKARVAFEAIDRGQPAFSEARWGLARLAVRENDLPAAHAELTRASDAAPDHDGIASDLARLCESLSRYEEAVRAWQRVAEMRPDDPDPLQAMGEIEARRKRWGHAGEAFRACLDRSQEPRPRVLAQLAHAYTEAGERDEVASAYLALLGLLDEGEDLGWLAVNPEQYIHNRLREIDYVPVRNGWIPRDQFLARQGWVRHSGGWMRPEVVQLHEIVADYGHEEGELRVLPDERYRDDAAQRRIAKGMSRTEVITAWGFFEDQNVLKGVDGETTYEQLIFGGDRRVYLRSGLVFLWSE